MSKNHDAKKNVKKAPTKTPQEKREAKRIKQRYGMRVSGASIRRIQLALLEQARKKAEKSSRKP